MRAESPTAATILCAAAADETSRATMSRSRESGIQRSVKGLRQTRYSMKGRHGRKRPRQVQTDPLNALLLEIQFPGRCVREVDDSTLYHGAAVIHAHNQRAAVAQVRDLHIGPKWQGRVCSGQVVHIERFTAGGLLAVEIAAVPGGCSHLVRFRFFGQFCFRAWFRLRSYRAILIVVRARVSLSRSQAGDTKEDRQSMSNALSHSVHLA